jgi:hypothetical protein
MQPARQLEGENFGGTLGEQLDHGIVLLFGNGFSCLAGACEDPMRYMSLRNSAVKKEEEKDKE